MKSDRVPASESVRAVVDALDCFLRKQVGPVDGSTHGREDEQLEPFGRLADAIRGVRPSIHSVTGWSFAVRLALPKVVEIFDAIVADWGWESLTGDAATRAEYVAAKRRAHAETYEPPMVVAALEWTPTITFDHLESFYDGSFAEAASQIASRYGDRASSLREISYEAGRDRFKECLARFHQTPLYGRRRPEIVEHLDFLWRTLQKIKVELDHIDPTTQSPRSQEGHSCAADMSCPVDEGSAIPSAQTIPVESASLTREGRRGRVKGVNRIDMALSELARRMKDNEPADNASIARSVGCTVENLKKSKRYQGIYKALMSAMTRATYARRGFKRDGFIEAVDDLD